MLRNDLINYLVEQDNDTVTVSLNGLLVDVESVSHARGQIVLILDPEDMRGTLQQIASGNSWPGEEPVKGTSAQTSPT